MFVGVWLFFSCTRGVGTSASRHQFVSRLLPCVHAPSLHCSSSDGGGGGLAAPCPLDPFVIVPDQCTYVDHQVLKLQVMGNCTAVDSAPWSSCVCRVSCVACRVSRVASNCACSVVICNLCVLWLAGCCWLLLVCCCLFLLGHPLCHAHFGLKPWVNACPVLSCPALPCVLPCPVHVGSGAP